MGVERRIGRKTDPAEWVRCRFAENVAQPSELGAKDESGKAVGTAATAYFFMRDPTDVGGGGKKRKKRRKREKVGGGEFEYATEIPSLGGIVFLLKGGQKREQVQTPSALVPHEGVHLFGLGFYG